MAIFINDLARIDFSDVVESGAAPIPPTHPGEILLHDFMEPLALTADVLASALNIPIDRVHGVLAKTQAIVSDMALRIARYFGTSAEFWLGLRACRRRGG